MNAHDEERMKQLLRQALPRMAEAEPARDLWPAMLRQLDAKADAPPWFDWALLGGLVMFAAFFPASIPLFLYYL